MEKKPTYKLIKKSNGGNIFSDTEKALKLGLASKQFMEDISSIMKSSEKQNAIQSELYRVFKKIFCSETGDTRETIKIENLKYKFEVINEKFKITVMDNNDNLIFTS